MPGGSEIVMLVGAGLVAGFVAGLIGLGGGVIFAPVLLFYYNHAGVAPEMVPKLTAGSSLLCTLIAAAASAWFQERKDVVAWRIVAIVGSFSAGAVFLVARFVTTQPWYDQRAFQIVLSIVLMVVVARMVGAQQREQPASAGKDGRTPRRTGWPVLAATGGAAGAVASAAGVGGGIVLVPAYDRFLRLPMHKAVGTSSATIVLISAVGVLSYALMGWGTPGPATALGYVDAGRALFLAVPSVLTARLGVHVAHRAPTRVLEWSFAAVAVVAAGSMIYDALGG